MLFWAVRGFFGLIVQPRAQVEVALDQSSCCSFLGRLFIRNVAEARLSGHWMCMDLS